MSRTVDIDFTFGEAISVSEVLYALLGTGLRMPSDTEVPYLVDEDGMFEWQKAAASDVDDVISRLADKRWEDRAVGMTLLLPDGPHGGDLLFHPGQTSVSFVVAVHPRHLPDSSRFCDLGWYLARLVPALEPLGLAEIEARDAP
ncbi:hypothetical protein PYK79_07845 [Streptomyces sp. ID05-04B]|uniref:hypothetical protein n=1 Tax=Streptomyces sp. ID05-04B TaxID=3028661 RepID=UPI0029C1C70D|nr:hypothetical protein [Streptomyces sp. ID05-04B]MDX5563230.1 hypothetical protein [Streptomyces sp. ID05-04B]